MNIPVDKLQQAAAEILVHLGESAENAARIADCLVKADMRGITTHGTYLLKVIEMRVNGGQLKLPTIPCVVSDSGATALIDGADGIGMVAGLAAMDLAISKAKQYGIGLVLLRNTNNIGSLACYTQLAAEQGMIAFMSGNAAPAMAPWGGAEPFMGTNPLAISIPADGAGFTADMASSVVARGKIRKAARNGTAIPAGWALGHDGAPTTDPQQALDGTLLPIGGPKGSALAMSIDIISGLLAGSGYGPQLRSFHALEGPTRVGASCIAMDVSRFMEIGTFKKLMSEYAGSVKQMKTAEGFNEILLPGEMEYRKETQSRVCGIDMDSRQTADLNDLLAKAGSSIRLSD